jgi:hypothetical protein
VPVTARQSTKQSVNQPINQTNKQNARPAMSVAWHNSHDDKTPYRFPLHLAMQQSEQGNVWKRNLLHATHMPH